MRRLAARWGGAIAIVDEIDGITEGHAHDISFAPFDAQAAIDYARGIIYVEPDTRIGTVIHEMGHVFACQVGPRCSDEWSWLGWEIALARLTGCMRQWSRSMADYVVIDDHAYEWRDLDGAGKRRIARERIAAARAVGLIDAQGRPQSARGDLLARHRNRQSMP